MDLLRMLRKLGDRIGIIELTPHSSQPAVPTKIQTRSITLAELVMTIQIDDVRELAAHPADLSVPFDEVFKAAGIHDSATGWNVERLEEFLRHDRIRKMERAEAQQKTLQMLAENKVDARDVIRDAMSRDQALDAFEESISKKRDKWRAEKKQRLAALEKEMADEENNWAEWRRRKRQYERDMAHAVGYLIDQPVISIQEE